jgi:hypothetical protein
MLLLLKIITDGSIYPAVPFTFLPCIITFSVLRSTFNYVIVRPKAYIYLENSIFLNKELFLGELYLGCDG